MIPAEVLVEPTGPNCKEMNFSDVKKGIRLSGGVKSNLLSSLISLAVYEGSFGGAWCDVLLYCDVWFVGARG